jgi:hypothetical protein
MRRVGRGLFEGAHRDRFDLVVTKGSRSPGSSSSINPSSRLSRNRSKAVADPVMP